MPVPVPSLKVGFNALVVMLGASSIGVTVTATVSLDVENTPLLAVVMLALVPWVPTVLSQARKVNTSEVVPL